MLLWGWSMRQSLIFISVSISSRFPNDPKIVEYMWSHQIPWLCFWKEILGCISLMTQSWELCLGSLDLAPPREHLQLFLLLLVFMQEAQICCHLFLTVSSLFQPSLLALWVLADVAAVMRKQEQQQHACWNEWEEEYKEASASELIVLSSFAFPGASTAVCWTPRESRKEKQGLAAVGCEELLGAWWQHGIHLVQAKIKFGGYTQRELIKPVIKPVLS